MLKEDFADCECRKEWMSSNRLEIGATQCSVDQATGKQTCVLASGSQQLVPQNARRICNTPTCQ